MSEGIKDARGLLTNGGPEALRRAVNDVEPAFPEASGIVRGVLSFPTDPPAETVLAGNSWLRLGDLAFLNSSAGSGKSVGAVQMSIAWGLGLPYFGIHPSRPLKILHFVGEDDESTLGQCREGLIENAAALFGRELKPGELAKLDHMVRIDFTRRFIGKAFPEYIDSLLKEEAADLILINPLLSYVGGEIVANASEFLRDGLMPLLQNHRAACLVMHHTPKLSRDGWSTIDPTYSGIGGSEVANAPRAILTLMPTKAAGLHVLKAAKRVTTGWKDEDGGFTDHAFFRRTDNPQRPAWLPVSHEEAAELVEGVAPPRTAKKASVQDVAQLLVDGAMKRQAVIETLQRDCRCGETAAKNAVKESRQCGLVDSFEERQPGKAGKAEVWLCLPEQKHKWTEPARPFANGRDHSAEGK